MTIYGIQQLTKSRDSVYSCFLEELVMRATAIFLMVGLSVAFATASRANTIEGKWDVTLTGAVASRCVAEVYKSGRNVTGEIVCREAGLKLPISGEIQGSRIANTAATASGWTATLGADAASGTYMSPMGPGAWTAQRRD